MNALDGLFSRQVPTRASGAVSGSVAEAQEGGAAAGKDSFASALFGEVRKQSHGSANEDQADLNGNGSVTQDVDVEAELVMAEMFDFHFGSGVGVESDTGQPQNPDGQNGNARSAFEITGYFGSELPAFAETKSVGGNPSDAKNELAESAGGDASAAPMQIVGKIDVETATTSAPDVPSDSQPSQLPAGKSAVEVPMVPVRGENVEITTKPGVGQESSNRAILVDHAVRSKPIADPRKDANGAVSYNGSADPDIEVAETRVDQGRDRTAAIKAARTAQDAPIDNVRVIDRRTIAAPQTSQNGEAIAKAVIQDVAQFGQAVRGEAARAASAAPVPSAVNMQAVAQAVTPKTLHTLNIQLNPHSLGQVTAVLKMAGDELSVELKVQTAEAYRQLKEDSTGIVKALRAQGYGIETISVQHVPTDRQAMTVQQGQQPVTNGQQFQFQDGDARSASGNQSESGRQRSLGVRDGNNTGDGGNDHLSPSSDGIRRSDGVYL